MDESKYQFNRELLVDVLPEMGPLTIQHFNEIGQKTFSDHTLKPSVDCFLQLEQSDKLRLFTIRKATSLLVGYQMFIIGVSWHYQVLQASSDILFIEKGSRGIGLSFLKYCNQQLKDDGIQYTIQTSPAKQEIGSIFKRLGYTKLETQYIKKLGE